MANKLPFGLYDIVSVNGQYAGNQGEGIISAVFDNDYPIDAENYATVEVILLHDNTWIRFNNKDIFCDNKLAYLRHPTDFEKSQIQDEEL